MPIKKLFVFGPRAADGRECIDYFKGNESVKVYPFHADITDSSSLRNIIAEKPNFIVNFAALTSMSDCAANPSAALETNAGAIAEILNLVKELSPNTIFASIGSIEEYQSNNIYAISKRAARDIVKHYRDNYKLSCCHLTLSHHQSKYQKYNFVARKITSWVAKEIMVGKIQPIKPLEMGNLETKITFIPARHIILAINRAINHNPIQDFTFSSLDKHSIREALEYCMSYAGLEFERIHRNTNDYSCVEYVGKDGATLVNFNRDFYENRHELDLSEEINRTLNELNWSASGCFREILKEMMDHDIKLLNRKV